MKLLLKRITDYFLKQEKFISESLFNFIRKHPFIILTVLFLSIIILIIQNNLLQASLYFGVFIIYSSLFIFFRKQIKQDTPLDLDTFEIVYKLAGVFAIVFLGVTYIFAAIGKYIIPKPLHFGSIDTWIQFAGSILSGTLTIIALAFTISEQEKVRKIDTLNLEKKRKEEEIRKIEELEYRNPPILKLFVDSYNSDDNIDLISREIELNFDDKTNFELNLNFELENISSTSVTNIKIIESNLFLINQNKENSFNLVEKIELKDVIDMKSIDRIFEEYELVPPQTSIYFNSNLILNKKEIFKQGLFTNKLMLFEISIEYSSTLLRKLYNVNMSFNFQLTYIKHGVFSLRIEKPKNKYKLPKYEI